VSIISNDVNVFWMKAMTSITQWAPRKGRTRFSSPGTPSLYSFFKKLKRCTFGHSKFTSKFLEEEAQD
jgi:hypothetical protein